MGSTPGRWIDAEVTPRLRPAAWSIVLIGLGLVVRGVFAPAIGEHLGNVAWGAMWVALVWLAVPRWRLVRIAAVALVIVWGIELLQITGVPAAIIRAWPASRWLLGTSFAVHDLVGNGLGVLAGAVGARRLGGKR